MQNPKNIFYLREEFKTKEFMMEFLEKVDKSFLGRQPITPKEWRYDKNFYQIQLKDLFDHPKLGFIQELQELEHKNNFDITL